MSHIHPSKSNSIDEIIKLAVITDTERHVMLEHGITGLNPAQAKAAIEAYVSERVIEARTLERNRIRKHLWSRGIKIPLTADAKLVKTKPKVEPYEIENLDTRVRVKRAELESGKSD